MADELDAVTELDGIIPEIWSREVHRANYSVAIGPKVAYSELTDEMDGVGDTIHLHNFPRITVNDVDPLTGVCTNQSVTIVDVSLLIDKWKEATVEIVDKAGSQSVFGSPEALASKFAAEFGPALAEKSDKDLFANYSNLTTNISGDGTSIMGDAIVRAGLQKLDEARIPKSDRNFVLSPKAFWDLFGQDKYMLAYATGMGKGTQIIGPENVPGLYGCKWYESAEVTTAAGKTYNLLLHKKCLAIGMQKTLAIVKFAKIALSTRINGNCVYGTKTFREDFGCQLVTIA